MQLGLGEIGLSTIESVLAQPKHMKLVAAVDVNPSIIGKPLREFMRGRKRGLIPPPIKITGSIKDALKSAGKIDVAIMTTGSRTVDVKATIDALADAGIHVVSSCEELSWPALRAPREAKLIDARAKKAGVAVLGTGVNPGFAMDAFAAACTGVCSNVKAIRVIRSLDASKRRYQLQKKVGAGMTVAAVKALIKKNAIGHVGLAESAAMIAAALGWRLTKLDERFEPVVADHKVNSEHFTVLPGQVRGMRMTAVGTIGKRRVIDLELTMALDADTFDEVVVDSDPAIVVRTKTGFPGDTSTANLLANCARLLGENGLQPGLNTMLDVLKLRSVGV